jgi:hypothetical protein
VAKYLVRSSTAPNPTIPKATDLVWGGSLHSRAFGPTLTWVQLERGTPADLVEPRRCVLRSSSRRVGHEVRENKKRLSPHKLHPYTTKVNLFII